MITLVSKNTVDGSRILAFKFVTTELRNSMLSGFRFVDIADKSHNYLYSVSHIYIHSCINS
jgi:hypothetical protein